MNGRQKASLICILGLGIFASAAALVKLTYLTNYGRTGDWLWDSRNLTIWTVIECNIGTYQPIHTLLARHKLTYPGILQVSSPATSPVSSPSSAASSAPPTAAAHARHRSHISPGPTAQAPTTVPSPRTTRPSTRTEPQTASSKATGRQATHTC